MKEYFYDIASKDSRLIEVMKNIESIGENLFLIKFISFLIQDEMERKIKGDSFELKLNLVKAVSSIGNEKLYRERLKEEDKLRIKEVFKEITGEDWN